MEIFKLQKPIATNDPQPRLLAYNKDRSQHVEIPPTSEVLALFDNEGITQFKIFVRATIEGDTFRVHERTAWQGW